MKIFLILLSFFFIMLSPLAFAKEGRNGGDDQRVRIEIREREENEIEIEEEFEDRVEIKGNTFEIRGAITEIFEDGFMVLGNRIFVDTKMVSDFKQRGILKAGERVRVEGVIMDGKKFAEEIRTLRENEEVRVEIKENPQRIEIKARGPLDQIRDLLQQFLNLLKL